MTVNFCSLIRDTVAAIAPMLERADLCHLSRVNRHFKECLDGIPEVQMQFTYENILSKPANDLRYKIGISKDNTLCIGTNSDISLWHLIHGEQSPLQYVRRLFIEEGKEENIISLCNRLKELNYPQHIHLNSCTITQKLLDIICALPHTKVHISQPHIADCTIPDEWSDITPTSFYHFLKEESDQESLLEIKQHCVVDGKPFQDVYNRLKNLSTPVKYSLIHTIWSSAIEQIQHESLNIHTIEKKVCEYLSENPSISALTLALQTELKNYFSAPGQRQIS